MKIRKAKKEDVYACVPLIYSAAMPLFDYIYQQCPITAENFIHKEFLSERGYTSYKLHWVVEHEGQVVAVVACYAKEDLPNMDGGTIRNILSVYKLKFSRVLIRAFYSGSVVTKPSITSLHVANFGVSSNYRSQGIGRLLLNYLKTLAEQQGYSSLSLDVSYANPRGQKLYEKIGFVVVQDSKFKGIEGELIPNGRRMEWKF
ncbi:MAG: GNAT family N-acetyltransferase [Moraxellaceae bacterium]|nr:GNAT family N-acetyltransferase [Moraxellaceae bacterium]